MGVKGWRIYKNNYKGHMDKTRGWWKQGREVGMARVAGKGRKLYLKNNNIEKYLIKKE